MAVANRALTFLEIQLPEFSGGLNLRDAATELALNESPDLWNVTVDERGGIQKRLGYTKWNASAVGNKVTYGYYSRVADKILWYSIADGKLYSDPGTGVLTLRRTWTTGSRICICDFAGAVYAVHPVDGLYSSTDGVTWTAVTAATGTVPKGDLLAAWQNKLWVSGDTAATTRLYFSAAGDATKWASADGAGSNDLREGRDGDAPIVCLFGATGSDFQTNPSLLVFKQRSTHRVTSATTASYVTIDAANGAAGRDAVTTAYGRVYTVTGQGVFETDGLSALVPVGQKLAPKFTPAGLDYTKESGFAAGAQNGRLVFSVASTGASANDVCFEYHPLFKSFTARSDAAACYVSYTKSADSLLAASPSVTGQVYKLNTGGNDDSASIQSWFLTRVFEPFGGLLGRVQRLETRHGGTVKVQILPDFATASTQETLSTSNGTGFAWGTGAWGSGLWGGGDVPESYSDSWQKPAGRAFQLRFDETSTLTRTGMALLEGTYQPTLGAWAVYGCNLATSLMARI